MSLDGLIPYQTGLRMSVGYLPSDPVQGPAGINVQTIGPTGLTRVGIEGTTMATYWDTLEHATAYASAYATGAQSVGLTDNLYGRRDLARSILSGEPMGLFAGVPASDQDAAGSKMSPVALLGLGALAWLGLRRR